MLQSYLSYKVDYKLPYTDSSSSNSSYHYIYKPHADR